MKDLKYIKNWFTYVNIHGKGLHLTSFIGLVTTLPMPMLIYLSQVLMLMVKSLKRIVSENKDHHFSYTYDLNASYRFSIDQHNINVFAGFKLEKFGGSVTVVSWSPL